MERMNSLEELGQWRESLLNQRDPNQTTIFLCQGPGCSAYGGDEVYGAFEKIIQERDLGKQVSVKKTGCHGFCERAPLLVISPPGIFYQQVSPDDVPEILFETLIKKNIIGRLLYKDPITNTPYLHAHEIPFYEKQSRVVLSDNGRIDPTSLEDYIACQGYTAIGSILTSKTPEEVIEAVEKSGLRGRGGAGFPTGVKWRLARQNPGKSKFVICNADEGDPGAFMDRSILEGNPHSVLEGMAIAGYAIGASEGYIYVRAEYPIATKHLGIALTLAEERGLLGDHILGSNFNFHVEIREGAGAFVCGEETALIASLEGRRGMPRIRPPFPAQAGFRDLPTSINNVETFANLRSIILNGWEWYAAMGTEKSKGTKIFSVTGRINNTGLVEVPMGTTLRQVIYDIGGGIPKGRKFKGVQMGGPSGGCIPARYLDIPIDYDSLRQVGSMMGSGGMIVMDENTCMVDIARYFLSFTQDESCGKCSPCRQGTTQMLKILTRITKGEGKEGDIELLQRIGQTVKASSLCGLGQSCANPVLTTIQHFREEYELHIREKRCPAATCDAMVISACQHACPAGIDVPNYVAAIAEGNYAQAVEIIREKNPFPAVCGRICIHPCEFKCRRGELDEPVAIRSLKRYASDWYFEHLGTAGDPFPKTKTQKVAVVGAGPAGLTCAYFLAKAGYLVTVFEAQPIAGGMLGITVPEFRLPREIIQKEIDYIESCGVEIRYNTPIDANHTVTDLKKEGYEAVFIAAGAQSSKRINVPGEEDGLEGLYYGLKFLTDIKTREKPRLEGQVIVVGGGNVAIDVARSALRLGAEEVQLYCLESRTEMPAWEKEIKEAIEEGIILNPSWGPKEILRHGNKVVGMEFIRCLSVFDSEGRFKPTFDPETTRLINADTVIISIGQAVDLSFLSRDSQLERALWGTLGVNENTLATNIPGIFAGGDFTTGPTFLIRAIGSGRRAAVAIDQYLKGEKGQVLMSDEKTEARTEALLAQEEETIGVKPRVKAEIHRPQERIKDFREVEIGITQEQAHREAKRCLRCDLEKK
jgi:NADH-quinone oxidoreductase subunit F